jgi:hypothetical protein
MTGIAQLCDTWSVKVAVWSLFLGSCSWCRSANIDCVIGVHTYPRVLAGDSATWNEHDWSFDGTCLTAQPLRHSAYLADTPCNALKKTRQLDIFDAMSSQDPLATLWQRSVPFAF